MLFCRVSDGLYRHRPLRTLTQPFQAFKQPANVCVELAFPDHHDVPTGGLKRCVIAPVAFRVAVELSGPERDIRGRPLPALRAIMPVPETAMDKDRVPIAREDNIRPAGKIGPMKAKPKTIAEQRSPHRELQLRVASFYLGHHRRPHAGGDVVGHGRRSSPYLSAAESGRRDYRDAAEGIKRQQIGIAGYSDIRLTVHGQLKDLVVIGITARRHSLGDRHKLRGRQHPPHLVREHRCDFRRYSRTLKNRHKFLPGDRAFRQAAISADPSDRVGRPRRFLQGGADGNVGVDDQPHPS